MAAVVLVVLWLAAAYRLWVSVTQPTTLWRTSFTIAVWSVSAALTIHEAASEIDAGLGVPNLAGLAARVTMLVGLGFLLVYHEYLRRADVPTQRLAGHLALATVVIAVEIVAWAIAPLHDRQSQDLLEYAAAPSVVLYCVAFWVYLASVLAFASRTCLAGGRTFRRTDPARSASLLLIGVGELLGIPVLLLWTASIVVRHQGGDADALNRLGDLLLPWPVLLYALGVLSVLTVPYALALMGRWREWRTLRPLWADLVRRYPEVHLDLKVTGGPLGRLQLRVERAVIETRDALRVAPVEARSAEEPVAVEAVARALRRPTDGSRTCAADVLSRPETRQADMEQLLELAGAYERVGHGTS